MGNARAAGGTDRAIARDLRSYVLRGFGWSAALAVTVQLSRIVSGVILVRLLTPSDYGLAGMALLVSSLVLAFADLGLGAGLVQRPHITEDDRSTVFWTSVLVGVVLTGAGIALAGPLAGFFGEPSVRPLFMAVSASFLFLALQTTQASLLQRAMDFRAIGLRVMLATVLAAAVAVTVAALGGGAWALIAQALAASLVSTALLWRLSRWRPSLRFSRRSLRNLGGFGITVLGARMLDYAQGNVDNLLVGRFLGSSPLGLYSVGYNVILLPVQRLIVPVQDALFPALSRIQDDTPRMARIWLRTTRAVSAVMAPAMLGVVVVAPDFVDVVLGHRWSGAVPVVRILAFVSLLQSFTAVAARALTALDRVGTVLRFSLFSAVLSVAAFAVGLRWGIAGVAASYAIVTVPVQGCLVLVATSALGIPRRAFLANFAGVLQAAGGMFVICWLIRALLVAADISAAVRLVLVIATGAAAYAIGTAWRSPEVVGELRSLRTSAARTSRAARSEGARTARAGARA